MPNRRRGEVGLELGGERYTLCLTLGALRTGRRIRRRRPAGPRHALPGGGLLSRDLIKLLGVALRGGGHDLGEADVAALPLDQGLEPVVQALTDCLLLTFGAAENPTHPQDP